MQREVHLIKMVILELNFDALCVLLEKCKRVLIWSQIRIPVLFLLFIPSIELITYLVIVVSKSYQQNIDTKCVFNVSAELSLFFDFS